MTRVVETTVLAIVFLTLSIRVAFAQSAAVGVGGLISYHDPQRPNLELVASVQVPVESTLLIEAEATRSTANADFDGISDDRLDRPFISLARSHRDFDALNVGANVFLRRPLGDWVGLMGGGAGVYRMTERFVAHLRCQPRVPGGCDDQPERTNQFEQTRFGPMWQIAVASSGRSAATCRRSARRDGSPPVIAALAALPAFAWARSSRRHRHAPEYPPRPTACATARSGAPSSGS